MLKSLNITSLFSFVAGVPDDKKFKFRWTVFSLLYLTASFMVLTLDIIPPKQPKAKVSSKLNIIPMNYEETFENNNFDISYLV